MSQLTLNSVLLGIIESMPTKSVENNFIIADGKVTKLQGKQVSLWSDEMWHVPIDTYFVFNPFQELITHEDSPALTYLNRMINVELNTIFGTMMASVIDAIIKTKAPKKRQLEMMGDDLKELDGKTLGFLESLAKVLKSSSRQKSIVDVVLLNSHPKTREVDGNKYATLRSPLLQQLAYHKKSAKIFDEVKPANKRVVTELQAILTMLLPEDFEHGDYYVFNKHGTAPRNKALHDLYKDVLERLEEVASVMKITDITIPVIHPNWTSGFAHIKSLLQSVPRDAFGTLGKVRAGASDEALAETEKLNRHPNSMAAQRHSVAEVTTAIPTGGIMGNMMNPNGIMANMPNQNGMMGNMMNPMMGGINPQQMMTMMMGMMNNGLNNPNNGAYGQIDTSTAPNAPAMNGVPPGGILGSL